MEFSKSEFFLEEFVTFNYFILFLRFFAIIINCHIHISKNLKGVEIKN